MGKSKKLITKPEGQANIEKIIAAKPVLKTMIVKQQFGESLSKLMGAPNPIDEKLLILDNSIYEHSEELKESRTKMQKWRGRFAEYVKKHREILEQYGLDSIEVDQPREDVGLFNSIMESYLFKITETRRNKSESIPSRVHTELHMIIGKHAKRRNRYLRSKLNIATLQVKREELLKKTSPSTPSKKK